MAINILTICDYGQVRSVGMKCYLNGLQRAGKNRIDKLKYDVIAVGSITSSKETIKMLKEWADIVIDVRKWIPEDIYGNCWNEDLQLECEKIWADICSQERYKLILNRYNKEEIINNVVTISSEDLCECGHDRFHHSEKGCFVPINPCGICSCMKFKLAVEQER
jgi:hypothetical protein